MARPGASSLVCASGGGNPRAWCFKPNFSARLIHSRTRGSFLLSTLLHFQQGSCDAMPVKAMHIATPPARAPSVWPFPACPGVAVLPQDALDDHPHLGADGLLDRPVDRGVGEDRGDLLAGDVPERCVSPHLHGAVVHLERIVKRLSSLDSSGPLPRSRALRRSLVTVRHYLQTRMHTSRWLLGRGAELVAQAFESDDEKTAQKSGEILSQNAAQHQSMLGRSMRSNHRKSRSFQGLREPVRAGVKRLQKQKVGATGLEPVTSVV